MKSENIKNILVICTGDFNKISVGSNYIKTYLNILEDYNYEYYEIKSSVDLFCGPLKKLQRLGSFPIISDLLLIYWVFFYLNKNIKNINNSLKNKSFSSIWFFANSLESILIGYKLSFELEKLGIKFNLCIWDSLDYITESKRISVFTKRKIFNCYKKLLRKANCITCISEGMIEDLDSKFGSKEELISKKSIVLPFPVTSSLNKKNTSRVSLSDSFDINIVFIGSTYCWREWNSFVAALDSIGWTLNNKKIIFHVYGRPNIRSYFYKKREGIIYYEAMAHDILMQEIVKYDFAYLPYFFDKNKKTVAKTSLPGKLSSYIQSELPVIFHGPDYASAAFIIKKYNIGVVLNSRVEFDFSYIITKLEAVSENSFMICIADFYDINKYIPIVRKIM